MELGYLVPASEDSNVLIFYETLSEKPTITGEEIGSEKQTKIETSESEKPTKCLGKMSEKPTTLSVFQTS